MDAQEKAVIDGIFERLTRVSGQPRDEAAERYIADCIRQQPHAPYALAQTVYVQEQALLNAAQEIEALKAENRRVQAEPTAPQGGGFLGGLFGGGATPARSRTHVPAFGRPASGGASGSAAQHGSGASPWSQPSPRQGMGFLGTAAAAAAGVAGGMVIGNMLSSAFGGGAAQAASPPPTSAEPPPQEDGFAPDDVSSPAGFDDGMDLGGDSFEL